MVSTFRNRPYYLFNSLHSQSPMGISNRRTSELWIYLLASCVMSMNLIGCRNEPQTPPSDLRLTCTSSHKVTINWRDNSKDEEGFVISRRKSNDSPFVVVARVGQNVTEWVDKDILALTQYSYKVASFRQDKTSTFAGPCNITALPEPPKWLSVHPLPRGWVELSWACDYDADEFEICRKSAVHNLKQRYIRIPPSQRKYVDKEVSEGDTYKYEVRILKSGKSSRPVVSRSVTTSLAKEFVIENAIKSALIDAKDEFYVLLSNERDTFKKLNELSIKSIPPPLFNTFPDDALNQKEAYVRYLNDLEELAKEHSSVSARLQNSQEHYRNVQQGQYGILYHSIEDPYGNLYSAIEEFRAMLLKAARYNDQNLLKKRVLGRLERSRERVFVALPEDAETMYCYNRLQGRLFDVSGKWLCKLWMDRLSETLMTRLNHFLASSESRNKSWNISGYYKFCSVPDLSKHVLGPIRENNKVVFPSNRKHAVEDFVWKYLQEGLPDCATAYRFYAERRDSMMGRYGSRYLNRVLAVSTIYLLQLHELEGEIPKLDNDVLTQLGIEVDPQKTRKTKSGINVYFVWFKCENTNFYAYMVQGVSLIAILRPDMMIWDERSDFSECADTIDKLLKLAQKPDNL